MHSRLACVVAACLIAAQVNCALVQLDLTDNQFGDKFAVAIGGALKVAAAAARLRTYV